MTLREQIMSECENYKTSFRYVEDLYEKQSDYDEAKNGTYDFISCPQSYACLEDVKEFCGTDNMFKEDTIEECRQCWKNALGE